MTDQHQKYASNCLLSEAVGEHTESTVTRKVIKGDVQLVFISPENIFENKLFQGMLLSQPYQEKLVDQVVDEAKCQVVGI